MKLAKDGDIREASEQPGTIKDHYVQGLHLVERLHRRLLDVIKNEFERSGDQEVNAVQALLLFNIGDQELTPGELRTRGHYLGSNVSYNLRKLVDAGYISHERSSSDRRSVRISLTEEGHRVRSMVERLYERHVESLEEVGGISLADLKQVNEVLARLERFWLDQIRYRL
ncbi:MarR family transcriptional regulator [Kaustia mangrovi]|uniref:MarR family transcriptional regulator n=1 Tax=Kaustia mangrovi TaxID=2593653 RepID=A0A7S8C805_9HYPH|nr:MarR family transcriptional regulator [Kaustia mangrovi]QPC44901.1 MarR family transcriptional regulator [Kaustia mangrovi]